MRAVQGCHDAEENEAALSSPSSRSYCLAPTLPKSHCPSRMQSMAQSVIPSSYVSSHNVVGAVSKPTHRYTTEISQMAFVFNGESSREMDEDVCQYIEDIVRGQLADIVSCYNNRPHSLVLMPPDAGKGARDTSCLLTTAGLFVVAGLTSSRARC